MNILRFAFELFILYMLYKLIVDFIIPVYRSTKKMKKQFGDMQTRMQDDIHNFQNERKSAESNGQPAKQGDYIEFEEIKK